MLLQEPIDLDICQCRYSTGQDYWKIHARGGYTPSTGKKMHCFGGMHHTMMHGEGIVKLAAAGKRMDGEISNSDGETRFHHVRDLHGETMILSRREPIIN
jgi:hypothetical protein